MALGGNLKKQKLIPDKKVESVKKKTTPTKKEKKKDAPQQATKGKAAKAAVKKAEKPALKKVASSKSKVAPKKAASKPVKAKVSSKEELVPQVIERKETASDDRFVSREALMARQEMRKRFAAEVSALGDKTIQLIAFNIGDEAFALDINHVKEVVATPMAAKVPGMPPYYKGMVNIRGNTVMALDLNEKLGLMKLDQPDYIMVLKTSQLSLGILLNELPNALKVKGTQISASLKTLGRSAHEVFIKGLIKLENQLVFYIDVEELVNSDKAVEFPENLVNYKK